MHNTIVFKKTFSIFRSRERGSFFKLLSSKSKSEEQNNTVLNQMNGFSSSNVIQDPIHPELSNLNVDYSTQRESKERLTSQRIQQV